MTPFEELARLGVATVHEAQGKTGLVDLPLVQVVPGSRVAGRVRTALCGNGDNLMVHAAVAHAEPGDVLVLTMPEPTPVALVGDLLATQALGQGVAAMLVDGAVRDLEELRELGLPIWARHVRAQGATKQHVGSLDTPVRRRRRPDRARRRDGPRCRRRRRREGGPGGRRRAMRRASARRTSASCGRGTRRVSGPTM